MAADLIVHGDCADVDRRAVEHASEISLAGSEVADEADLGGESPCFAHLFDEPLDD